MRYRNTQEVAAATEAARQRHYTMVAEWEAAGHRATACSGHMYPQHGCPAPEVHDRMAGQHTEAKHE